MPFSQVPAQKSDCLLNNRHETNFGAARLTGHTSASWLTWSRGWTGAELSLAASRPAAAAPYTGLVLPHSISLEGPVFSQQQPANKFEDKFKWLRFEIMNPASYDLSVQFQVSNCHRAIAVISPKTGCDAPGVVPLVCAGLAGWASSQHHHSAPFQPVLPSLASCWPVLLLLAAQHIWAASTAHIVPPPWLVHNLLGCWACVTSLGKRWGTAHTPFSHNWRLNFDNLNLCSEVSYLI